MGGKTSLVIQKCEKDSKDMEILKRENAALKWRPDEQQELQMDFLIVSKSVRL